MPYTKVNTKERNMKFTILLLCGLITFKAAALSPEERKKLFVDSIQSLKGTGIEKKVPQFGERFPDVTIADKKISEWVKEGPLLLVVYRGGWCPYCVKQLKDIEANLDKFKSYNVTVIAVAPETAQEAQKTKKKNNLSFNVFSDKDGATLKKMGLTFRVDDKVAEEYKNLGINLAENQGNKSQELPVPVTYIIGKDMKIQFGYVDADYTKRPSVEDVLSSLK